MNIENINKLIDALQNTVFYEEVDEVTSGVDVFDMNHYYHDCGTPSCIAGWAVHLADPGYQYNCNDLPGLKNAAAAYIGLDKLSDIYELFTPDCVDLYEVTPEEAIRTLEKLRDTGEVNWSHAESYDGEFDEDDVEE